VSDEDHEPQPPRDENGDAPPWWHSEPQRPPADSVFVEGLKLAGALRDWAVESGAVAAATEMAQNAATAASGYLSQVADQHPAEPEPEAPHAVVRCTDCPICQGLDALERTNPELAQSARSALSQINVLVAGFLGQSGQAND
jgi:hypothetical protein